MEFVKQKSEGLVIFADGSDNPGGDAPCDGTVALSALVEAGFAGSVVGVLYDPACVEGAHQLGVGAEEEFEIGGKTDSLHGPPLRTQAGVGALGDGRFVHHGRMWRGVPDNLGRIAVLEANGVEIVLASRRAQLLDGETLRIVGIAPETRRLLVAKSAVRFRADLGPLAAHIFDADTPDIHRPDFNALAHEHVRRPIYPIDTNIQWPATSR